MIGHCHEGGVVGHGDIHADVMVIGIAPGKVEWTETKRPFSGPSGKLMDSILKLIGHPRPTVWATNLICWWNDHPSLGEIDLCLGRLVEEIRTVKPKVIMLLGKIVAEQLCPDDPYIGHMAFGKSNGGAWYSEQFKCWMIVTNHPAAYLWDGGKMKVDIADAVRDFRKINLYLDAPKDFAMVKYSVAQTEDECNEIVTHYAEHEPDSVVAIDVETDYEKSRMLSIAFACEHGAHHIGRALVNNVGFTSLSRGGDGSHRRDRDLPPYYIRGPRWTFHLGQFDTNQIRQKLQTPLNIVEDTLLMSYSLDERGGGGGELDSTGTDRAVGIHGLKRLAREYCGAGYYDSKAHGIIPELSDEDLAFYNASDAVYTYRLQRYMQPLQEADDVREMYLELLIPAANTLRDIHEFGGRISKRQIKELAREWAPRWNELQDQLDRMAVDLGWDKPTLNLNSSPQMQRFVYDICGTPTIGRGKKARSVDHAIVQEIIKRGYKLAPFFELQQEWKGLDHDLNNYVLTIGELMDANDHVHPEALIHGTRTGRYVYHDPVVNTIPKPRTVGNSRARIRRIFVPSRATATGPRVLLEGDFRQSELWTAAMVSGDPQMLEDLRTGDFHARGAQGVFHTGPEQLIEELGEVEGHLRWDLLRDSFKIVVYGSFYGAGPQALMGDKQIQGRGSTGNYVLLSSIEQAKQVLSDFDARYPLYSAYRTAEKALVQREGEQQSITGRKRRYWIISSPTQLNQAINFPVSSLSHDFLMAGMIELNPLLAEFDAHILWDIHDALLMDVPLMYLREVVNLTERVLTKPRFGQPYGIPVDFKAGKNWLDVRKVEEVLKEYENSLAV